MLLSFFTLSFSAYNVQDGILSISDEKYVTSTDVNNVTDTYSKIFFGPGVNIICHRAFQNKARIIALEFCMECTLSTIGEYAFQGCTGLQSITLPSTVSNIFKYAFDGCHQLNTVCFCGYYNPSMLNGFNDIFGSAPVSDVKVVSSYQGTTFGLTQVTIGTDNECQDATNTQTATNTPDETYTNTQTKTYAPTNTKTNTQTRTYTQNPTNTHYPSNTEQAQQTNDEIAQEESMKEGLSTGAVVAITMVCTILVIALIGFLVYRIALRDKVQEFIKFTEG